MSLYEFLFFSKFWSLAILAWTRFAFRSILSFGQFWAPWASCWFWIWACRVWIFFEWSMPSSWVVLIAWNCCKICNLSRFSGSKWQPGYVHQVLGTWVEGYTQPLQFAVCYSCTATYRNLSISRAPFLHIPAVSAHLHMQMWCYIGLSTSQYSWATN